MSGFSAPCTLTSKPSLHVTTPPKPSSVPGRMCHCSPAFILTAPCPYPAVAHFATVSL